MNDYFVLWIICIVLAFLYGQKQGADKERHSQITTIETGDYVEYEGEWYLVVQVRGKGYNQKLWVEYNSDSYRWLSIEDITFIKFSEDVEQNQLNEDLYKFRKLVEGT